MKWTVVALSAIIALLATMYSAGADHPTLEQTTTECVLDIAKGEESEVNSRPTFTPAHELPRLLDSLEVLRQVRTTTSAGSNATAEIVLWTLVDPRGSVCDVRFVRGTGDLAMDARVEQLWRESEFTRPVLRFGSGMTRERAVPYWRTDTLRLR